MCSNCFANLTHKIPVQHTIPTITVNFTIIQICFNVHHNTNIETVPDTSATAAGTNGVDMGMASLTVSHTDHMKSFTIVRITCPKISFHSFSFGFRPCVATNSASFSSWCSIQDLDASTAARLANIDSNIAKIINLRAFIFDSYYYCWSEHGGGCVCHNEYHWYANNCKEYEIPEQVHYSL